VVVEVNKKTTKKYMMTVSKDDKLDILQNKAKELNISLSAGGKKKTKAILLLEIEEYLANKQLAN